jgi:hypothetical protein
MLPASDAPSADTVPENDAPPEPGRSKLTDCPWITTFESGSPFTCCAG